jgi:hypothetical protein
VDQGTVGLTCEHCDFAVRSGPEAWKDGQLQQCLACPGKDLFVRKDFSQRLGLGIVITGFGLSCVTWYFHWIILTYAILFLTAAVDVLLYVLVGDLLECYNCHAIYRGDVTNKEYAAFDLEIHERYRQQHARCEQLRKSRAPTEDLITHDSGKHAIH